MRSDVRKRRLGIEGRPMLVMLTVRKVFRCPSLVRVKVGTVLEGVIF